MLQLYHLKNVDGSNSSVPLQNRETRFVQIPHLMTVEFQKSPAVTWLVVATRIFNEKQV